MTPEEEIVTLRAENAALRERVQAQQESIIRHPEHAQ
jgi:hypothetical protein